MAKRGRGRDLAGLAALGALGYMLTRKQDGSTVPVEDRVGAPVGASAERVRAESAVTAPKLIEDDREPQRGDFHPGGFRRNEETGEMYDPNPVQRPAAPTRASPAKPAAPSRSVAAPAPRRNVAGDYTRKMGATAEEIAAYRNREVKPPSMTPEMRKKAESQAIERVTPEEYLVGGPGLKTLHSAAKTLANRPTALREVTQQALPAPTARLTGPSKADLVARDRAAREALRREEMLQENARRYGLDPNAPGYGGASRAVREQLGGGEFTLRKKGGVVKAKKMASGGAISSASKRGDGIATKGKTKCKMY
jgi:hypothetical protein